MKRRLIGLVFLSLIFTAIGAAEIDSLSRVFLTGHGLRDEDGDHCADRIAFFILVRDNATAAEIALAADIAARANLECLSQDLGLVKKESQIMNCQTEASSILVGTGLKLVEDLAQKGKLHLPALGPEQGAIFIADIGGQPGLIIAAGSEEALLKTGRAFFLRWPYLWEIWGREKGATYFSLEDDLAKFWKEEQILPPQTTIRSALYNFPHLTSAQDSIKRLKFDAGEIKDLQVELNFSDRKNRDRAQQALESLKLQHTRGTRTDLLTYSGCGQITFLLKEGAAQSRLILPRPGYPKRMLTPGYKEPQRKNVPEKNFDLLSLLTSSGLYSDSDKDGIPDSFDSLVIAPKNLPVQALAPLASRLMLHAAGASFPLIRFDTEIEDIKTVTSPLIIGENSASQELLKTGKLKVPPLEESWGWAQVIPKAFNKSNALAIASADPKGLEEILTYIAYTFPYISEYGEGNPQFADVLADLEKFLKGEKGTAEADIQRNLKPVLENLKDKELEYFQADLYLPQESPKFEVSLKGELERTLKTGKFDLKKHLLKENKVVFEKEREFAWEVEEALALLEEKIGSLKPSAEPIKISLGVSESPQVRAKIKAQIAEQLKKHDIQTAEVDVLCAYKQGFFWLTEKVQAALKGKSVSRLLIRFAEEKDDFSAPKRFYTEPLRWLQELYPADEILASSLGISLDRIEFEKKSDGKPVYEAIAYGLDNSLLLRESFSPRIREIPYLRPLPEWGKVLVTTGWLEIVRGEKPVVMADLKTDAERFWDYYQDEVLMPLYAHIMKKTDNEPSTSKQPYFKRLLIEAWLSEPDFRIGLDEEIVSSLESLHDEIYFDTLDFLRGITFVEAEEQDTPEDTSRLSAPGNILPLIHPSSEGGKGKVRVVFEDWQAASPQCIIKWKEKGREEEHTKKITFPVLKTKPMRLTSFLYDGKKEKLENLVVEIEFEKEAEYLALLDIIQSFNELREKGRLPPSFSYPRLNSLTLKIKHKDLEKEEVFPVSFDEAKKTEQGQRRDTALKLDEIISPEMCLDIAKRLGRHPVVKSYIGGRSYENREVPVLEIHTPQGKYVSLARLVTFKPTLFISARQHANEVSSTNYILRFAELLAGDAAFSDYVKSINFVLEPMENPDGASLAYELQRLTPFHSLHAGRYSSLGVDIGYQVGVSKPFLPEAAVRKNLLERWFPDITLNLHGYPSHEWVQAFSSYSPYLFRDYWIPKGWFAYIRAPRLPIYEKWKQAGDQVQKFIIQEMQSNARIKESNRKFYDRYWRWAVRWQPHLAHLELYDGLNLYAARRSSQETKLTPRTQITTIEETPELMDETARGGWLEFLCEQGLAYLRAHAKYLSQAAFEVGRIEEEVQDRVRIQFSRTRPGGLKKTE